jgi:hypothetical protein
VNEQIGDSYDVFIGILWGRFGTSTPRAPSGTIEEFERAFARLETPNAPEIMFYFKDAAIPPLGIDPEQLKLVQQFRSSLPERGGIYASFEDERGFQSSLRAHLAALAQKFSSTQQAKPAESPADESAEESLSDQDELGYLDYAELYELRMGDLESTLETISHATTRIGDQIRQRTEEITSPAQSPSGPKAARRVVKRAAEDMDAYATILTNNLPIMTSSREAALHALTQALAIQQDFRNTDHNEMRKLRGSLKGFLEAVKGSRRSLGEFRDSVGDLPRMTSDLNRAKRAVVGQLNGMLNELDSTSHTIANVLESVDKMLKQREGE